MEPCRLGESYRRVKNSGLEKLLGLRAQSTILWKLEKY